MRLRFKLQRERLLLSTGVNEFSIPQSFQTGSESQPAAYPVGTMGSSPEVKGRGLNLRSKLRLVPRLRMRGTTLPHVYQKAFTN